MTPLQQAAQDIVERWDSPDWKDTPHTAHYVAELRKALGAELQQAVEPVAWMHPSRDPHLLSHSAYTYGSASVPLYLHPPQPQATTPVPEGYMLVPIEPTSMMWAAVNKLDDEMAAGAYDGKGCSIEQAWRCLLEASKGANQ